MPFNGSPSLGSPAAMRAAAGGHVPGERHRKDGSPAAPTLRDGDLLVPGGGGGGARGALATACDAGEAGMASMLLEAGSTRAGDADAESTYADEIGGVGYTLLAAAAARGDVAVVRALAGSGRADVNCGGAAGCLPLVEAANKGHVACVAALLATPGIRANEADSNGNTALAVSACRGRVAVVRALLAADGIDANALGFERKSALMCAAEEGHRDCVVALLAARGIDADQANEDGETALAFAAFNGQAGCANALIAAGGVDVNHADPDGWTALDNSVVRNDAGLVRVFVAHQDIELGCRPGSAWTALHRACHTENAEIASLLPVAGGCRFAREAAPELTRRTALDLVGDSKEGRAVRAVFLSGVDYWRHGLHSGHSPAMRRVVRRLMLVRQRLAAPPPTLYTPTSAPMARPTCRPGRTAPARASTPAARPLVHLRGEEVWLRMCGFLRSADFPPF